MKTEKEKTEELLMQKDEVLRAKKEELGNKGKEQEKLQIELKMLQKMDFKPTMFISCDGITSNLEGHQGWYVYDIHGKRYLDVLAGLWSTTLASGSYKRC